MAKKPIKLAVNKTPEEFALEQLASMYKTEHEQAGELLTTLALVVFKYGGSIVVNKAEQEAFADIDWRLNAEDVEGGYEIKLETKKKESPNGKA